MGCMLLTKVYVGGLPLPLDMGLRSRLNPR